MFKNYRSKAQRFTKNDAAVNDKMTQERFVRKTKIALSSKANRIAKTAICHPRKAPTAIEATSHVEQSLTEMNFADKKAIKIATEAPKTRSKAGTTIISGARCGEKEANRGSKGQIENHETGKRHGQNRAKIKKGVSNSMSERNLSF